MMNKLFRRLILEPNQRKSISVASKGWHKKLTHSKNNQEEALKSALQWLCRSQSNESHQGAGFDRAFNLIDEKWELPYPETTGYIITTLINNAPSFPEMKLDNSAKIAGDWLKTTQFPSGAICAKQWHVDNTTPSVFNTGMVLHGYISLCEAGWESEFKAAADSAYQWLLKSQDGDGAWRSHAFNGIPHTYYTMVSWAIARYGLYFENKSSLKCASKNLNWATSNQRNNGWVDSVGFYNTNTATTHTLAYCAQGLVESGRLLENNAYIEAAANIMKPLNKKFQQHGFLPGEFDSNWSEIQMHYKNGFNALIETGHWECLTGTAQASCTNFAICASGADKQYGEAGTAMNKHLIQRQLIYPENENISGGLSGSWPMHGPYDTLCLPNHAAKFLIDALNWEQKYSGNNQKT